jgi:hypothetical protein
MKHNIGHLSEQAQEAARSLFGGGLEEPPDMLIKWCHQVSPEDGSGEFYAFQMHEVVPYSVRIGSQKSIYPEPQCLCGAEKPCKHIVWLMDQITKQVLYDHDPDSPLTLNERGYANELGDPFQRISEMRLPVLADGLRCGVGRQASSKRQPTLARRVDAFGILACLAGVDERDFDTYRPDLQAVASTPSELIHVGDIEQTIFSLLLASDRFPALVRPLLRPLDPPRDPYLLLHRRVVRIISELDSVDDDGNNVEWAAQSIERCVGHIDTLVARGGLSAKERTSAARALVRILRAVAQSNRDKQTPPGTPLDQRNLYARLIGSRDTGFVRNALARLPDQDAFTDELHDILDLIGGNGANGSWWAEMEAVMAAMTSYRRSGRRQQPAAAPRAIREAVPPAPDIVVSEHPKSFVTPVSAGPSSASDHLTVPSASSAERSRGSKSSRGSRRGDKTSDGGAGSKRSGGDQGGSSKRAR